MDNDKNKENNSIIEQSIYRKRKKDIFANSLDISNMHQNNQNTEIEKEKINQVTIGNLDNNDKIENITTDYQNFRKIIEFIKLKHSKDAKDQQGLVNLFVLYEKLLKN